MAGYSAVPTSSGYEPQKEKPGFARDPESLEDVPLAPGISRTENALRWALIKKVWGIVLAQLLLTTAVVATIYASQPVQDLVLNSLAFQLTAAILPLIGLIPLYMYRHRHAVNLILLAVWTALLSVGLGTACAQFPLRIVLEAVALTAAITAGLTAYAFDASARGRDLSFMAPTLVSCLFALIIWSVIQLFFPVGHVGQTVFALLGAFVFSGFIVVDTQNLILRYELDEYVWAAAQIYLDILNLLIMILRLLGRDSR